MANSVDDGRADSPASLSSEEEDLEIIRDLSEHSAKFSEMAKKLENQDRDAEVMRRKLREFDQITHEKEQRIISLTQKIEHFELESSLGHQPSRTDGDHVMVLDRSIRSRHGDDEHIHREPVENSPPVLSTNDMIKRLSAHKWSKPDNFQTLEEFQVSIIAQIEILNRLGVIDSEIAIDLNSHLMSSTIGPNYTTHCIFVDTTSISGVLQALKACNKTAALFSKSERFSKMSWGSREDLPSFAQRVENTHDLYGLTDPDDKKARLRLIKEQFCKGANLPSFIRDNIRHCQTVDDAVIIAMEDLEKIRQKQRQKRNANSIQPPHTQQQQQQQRIAPRGLAQQMQQPQRQRTFYPNLQQRAPQQPQQQHVLQQPQPQPTTHYGQPSLNDGPICMVSHPRSPPPPGTARAPHGMERDPRYRDILICLRCRVMNSHRANACPNKKYCSSCLREGHTDYEHMISQKINIVNRAALTHCQYPSAPPPPHGEEHFSE